MVLEFVVLAVGLESLQEVSLLGILPLELTTGMGGVLALRRRGGTVHGLSFVVLVLLQVERVGSLMVVTVVVFVEVAMVGKMVFQTWILLGVGWIGSPLLGLASFWDLLWCIGLPTNSRVLLNPLPRQSTLLLLVVALSSFGFHTP
jgi:hypothetical protein